MMKKVLLIEDDPVLRENTAELLELSNYDVKTAANGKIGLVTAFDIVPDVIICDIMMPELDGYGVLEELSHNEQTRIIPFIFLSAKTEHKDVRKGMNLGADDYITKPFEEKELINAIESRIAKAAILKEHQKKSFVTNINFDTRKDTLKNLNDLRTYFDKQGDYEEFEAGDEIYAETTNSNYLYLVEKGVVKNHRLDEYGKELITGLFNKGDFFGYTSFAYNSVNLETASALEPCVVLKVSKDRIKQLLEENHEVTFELINYLTDSLTDAKDQLLQMAYASVRKKTANTILKFVDKLKDRQQDGIRISRSDLAGVAGIATESLIRALSSLKKEGLIEIEGRTIKVVNSDGLSHVE